MSTAALWPYAVPPSERAGRARSNWAGAGLLLSAGLIVLWITLRLLDFERARVPLYSLVSRAAEGFLHPLWLVLLIAAAAGSAAVLRRRRAPHPAAGASLAPDVHLRAEPEGRLSVIITGNRSAVARDFVVERDEAAEARVRRAFADAARRVSTFAPDEEELRWTRDEIESAQRELYAIGLEIGRGILGGEGQVADAIADLPGEHLQLSLQRELAGIPWELAVPRPAGAFLWQLFMVTRQIRETAPVEEPSRDARAPWRVLVIANPEAGVPGRELPAAEREAAEIMETGAAHPEMLRVVRKSPATADELKRVLMEGWDVLHFAGHTVPGGGTAGAWALGENEVVNPAEAVAAAERAPGLVFANACSTTPAVEASGGADAADEMMRSGVGSYLCTLAEVHDGGSASFAGAFYRALAAGATLGAALTAARSALLGRHPFTWANYVLYGDPTGRISRVRRGGAGRA